MRHIHLDEGLRLRFPDRDEEFDQGVEIGMVAALMGSGCGAFARWIATGNLEQARVLAERMGYHVVVGASDAAFSQVTFQPGRARPKLKLVHATAQADETSAPRARLAIAR